MPVEFDFTSPTDKPALVGLTTPPLQEPVTATLAELGYKVHEAANHDEFLQRFSQLQYQVIVLEEHFNSVRISENLALLALQRMQMGLRRHTVIVLIGYSLTTQNSLEAFQQSVHAVVHPDQLADLGKIVQQTVAEANLFLATYRDTQNRIAQGKF
jgi:CheY-like chemotaxis protein